MTSIISLNDTEQRLAFNLAAERYLSNRRAGVKNTKMGSQPDSFTDLNSIGGELAVCKYYNCYPDTTVSPRSGGYDMLINNKRVDIKTTPVENGKLLCTLKGDGKGVDAYMLVIGTFPHYRIAGWCRTEDLRQVANIADLGWGKGYVMDQERLHACKRPDAKVQQ